MKVLVMGAGAVGSVVGGFLAEAGHAVSLVGRERYMEAIRQHGLKIGGIWGEHHVSNLHTLLSVAEIEEKSIPLILITTKSFDTEEATSQVLPLVGGDTLVISLQNGLGNVETISRLVGDERTVGGRVMFGVELEREGHFLVTVCADRVMLGSPSAKVPQERIAEVATAFTQAGIPAEATPHIQRFIWGKVLYNCCLNALSALLDTSYGELGEYPETREIIAAVISEVFALAQRRGVDLGFSSPAAYQEVFFNRLLPDTYSHHSSMLQDVKQGKKTEINAINGAVVRLGEEEGIATPANWLLTRLVQARERLSGGR